jgi:hypothetical protein
MFKNVVLKYSSPQTVHLLPFAVRRSSYEFITSIHTTIQPFVKTYKKIQLGIKLICNFDVI